MELKDILRCIDEEPELPDEPSPELLETLENSLKNKDKDLLIQCFRIVVNLTKKGIRNRILDLSKEYTSK